MIAPARFLWWLPWTEIEGAVKCMTSRKPQESTIHRGNALEGSLFLSFSPALLCWKLKDHRESREAKIRDIIPILSMIPRDIRTPLPTQHSNFQQLKGPSKGETPPRCDVPCPSSLTTHPAKKNQTKRPDKRWETLKPFICCFSY